MNTKRLVLFALVLSASFVANDRTAAQEQVEPIAATILPGEVFEQFYPHTPVPSAFATSLIFDGSVTNPSTSQSTSFNIYFDWIDPLLPGVQTSNQFVYTFPLEPGQTRATFGFGLPPISVDVPGNPPQVSIHITNQGTGATIVGSAAVSVAPPDRDGSCREGCDT